MVGGGRGGGGGGLANHLNVNITLFESIRGHIQVPPLENCLPRFHFQVVASLLSLPSCRLHVVASV